MKKTLLSLLIASIAASGASAQMLINGAGATFPYPIYSKWFNEYVKVDPSVRFNYQSIGSGGGQKQILSETVDFGASDGPMSDENLAKAPRALWHFPTVAGADVITYNLPGDPKLRIDGETIAGSFLGKITNGMTRPSRARTRTSSCPTWTSSSFTARMEAAQRISSPII